MLNEITNQLPGILLLIAIIAFTIWVNKYNIRVWAQISEQDVLNDVLRLEESMKNAWSLKRLDSLEDEIKAVVDMAKEKAPKYWKEYSKRLCNAYNNKWFHLVNIEHPGIEQSLIPYLSIN